MARWEPTIDATNPLLLAYYGDDFTGSNDVMEALTVAGVRTVLFLDPPGPDQLQRFKDARAVGIAGVSRSLRTEDMEAELMPIFKALRGLGAPLIHYKICSTFDSSPGVGSIGRAIELGQQALGSSHVPLVVGAPRLGRYTAFGNLFARSGPESGVFRLDRHPTMSCHPVTPMHESDLRVHLSRQTKKKVGLLDVVQLSASEEETERQHAALLDSDAGVVLFDVLSDDQLPAIGRLIWSRTQEELLFAVGSSGLEYALTSHWREIGLLSQQEPLPEAEATEQVAAISGSCSPVTERQIGCALEQGFAEVPLEPARLLDPGESKSEIEAAVEKASDVIEAGRSLILHTCRGPRDPRIAATDRYLNERGAESGGFGLGTARVLGEAMGSILREVLDRTEVRRAIIAGGDTSGYAARQMGIEALDVQAAFAPAMPLCRAHALGTSLDGLELVFKGGQTGKPNFFEGVRRGRQ